MIVINLFFLFILLAVASLFSFLETAIVAISEHKLIILAKQHKWAAYALSLKNKLDQVLIFSLFGNSFFNALITTLVTTWIIKSFNSRFILSIVTFLITLLIIIFSEATPKIIASKSSVSVLKLISLPLYYLFIIIKPLIWVIEKIVSYLTWFLSLGKSHITSVEELKALIKDKRTPFHESHRTILLNSLKLEQLLVLEVLIPLRNVEMINLNQNIAIISACLKRSKHTRIIVYDTTPDNIKGYLHAKDILQLINAHFDKSDLLALLHKINYIPEFTLIIKQIKAAQKTHEKIFLVVNEYGDTLGIVCLEDMLEIVFGDLPSEYLQINKLIIKEHEHSYIVNGATLVSEFNQIYQFNLPFSYDAMSINGLILKHLGMIPSTGMCFRIGNTSFEIIQVGQFWVEQVRINSLIKNSKYNE